MWATAETGANGWLRYGPLPETARRQYAGMPGRVVSLDGSAIAQSAAGELRQGVSGMLDRDLAMAPNVIGADAIVLGTADEVHAALPAWSAPTALRDEGFSLAVVRAAGHTYWVVAGKDDRGELYGVFHLLELIAEERPFAGDTESPAAPIRWVDQWDNFDGTIERGYAGRSIFFNDGHVRPDLSRVSEYGRLLASVGLNGCTVNNVNADLRTLDPVMLQELARIADAFRPWGVRMSLAVDLSSPQVVGGLSTFDPVDPAVAAWWQQKADEIYRLIPDFGGFVVKADSEGRAGPSQYGRTPVAGRERAGACASAARRRRDVSRLRL